MKRKLVETRAILTDALRSFAVAVAIVVLGHFMIWLVAEGVMMPDAFGGTPTPFEDQAESPIKKAPPFVHRRGHIQSLGEGSSRDRVNDDHTATVGRRCDS